LKDLLRPLVRTCRRIITIPTRQRWWRQLRTRGYRSGLLALGERNNYAIPGAWVTLDWQDADFEIDLRETRRLPFEESSQRFIYSAHLIEHLDDESLAPLLGECRRILEPGGTLRLETVDGERLVRAYLDDDREFFSYFHDSYRTPAAASLPDSLELHNVLVGELSCHIHPAEGRHVGVTATKDEVDRRLAAGDLDAFGRWCVSLQTPEQYRSGGHINFHYYGKLRRMLEEAGFVNVERMQNGVTRASTVSLRKIERPHRAFYSVYVEGMSPR
jgi:SAM-dependent methyltransferase